MPPAKVEEHLARADLAVSLSSRDGASLALLEAMALGAIPVLSDIPANRPWASPDGAVLVELSPADVADGIVRAAELDRETAIRHNRHIVLERADLSTNLGHFEDVMDALARGRRTTVGAG